MIARTWPACLTPSPPSGSPTACWASAIVGDTTWRPGGVEEQAVEWSRLTLSRGISMPMESITRTPGLGMSVTRSYDDNFLQMFREPSQDDAGSLRLRASGQVFDLPLCPRGAEQPGPRSADHAASRRSLSTIRGRTLPPPAAWQVEDLPYGDGGKPWEPAA